MTRYCDRSPCDPMLEALGRIIFGDSKGQFVLTTTLPEHEATLPIPIQYCPFCGTRLEQLSVAQAGTVEIQEAKEELLTE